MKNRYIFFKRLYKDYVIVFVEKDRYISFGIDKYLLEFINNKDLNYIIVDNDNDIKVKKFKVNKYREYVYKIFLFHLIDFVCKPAE